MSTVDCDVLMMIADDKNPGGGGGIEKAEVVKTFD